MTDRVDGKVELKLQLATSWSLVRGIRTLVQVEVLRIKRNMHVRTNVTRRKRIPTEKPWGTASNVGRQLLENADRTQQSWTHLLEERIALLHYPLYNLNQHSPDNSMKFRSLSNGWLLVVLKDGAYYCYCAYVLRISRYSDFLSPMLTNTGILLRGLKLSGESRS